MKESPEEFRARMDKARKESAVEANWGTGIAVLIYSVAAYFYFADSISIVYLVLLFVDSVLIIVAARLLIGIARSRRT